MNKQNVLGNISDKRLLNIKEVCTYTGIGQTSVRKYMDKIGATRKFGKRVLFDKAVIDAALNEMWGDVHGERSTQKGQR